MISFLYSRLKFARTHRKPRRKISRPLAKDSSIYSRLLLTLCAFVLLAHPARALTVSQLWASTYTSSGNVINHTQKIAADGYGKCAVTNFSNGDIVTIKYDAVGAQEWVNTFNGAGNGNDEPTDLVIDGGGNVYVSGYTTDAGSSLRMIVIKYNPFGVELWRAIYIGSASSPAYSDKGALAVDASGNVYVTGASGNKIVTIKYNSAGDQTWVKQYSYSASPSAPTSIVVDGSGNIFVGGYSASPSWGVLLKYSSAGTLVGTQVLTAGSIQNWVVDLGLDGSGNLLAAINRSGSFRTDKWNNALSTQLWTQVYPGTTVAPYALDVDAAGSVYITGAGSFSNWLTIKYNSSGSQIWTASNPYAMSYTEANDVVVGTNNDVYVTGGGAGIPCTTIRYDATTGNVDWYMNHSSNYWNEGNSIALDQFGNVFVADFSGPNGASSPTQVTIEYGQTGGGFSPPFSSAQMDYWMHDDAFDIGAEPNTLTASWNFWESPDLWVRWNPDGGLTHQNPDYKTTSPNYVYVRLYNNGGAGSYSPAKMYLYWTRTRSGELWDQHWTTNISNYNTGGYPLGGEINLLGTAMPGVPPGQSQMMKVPWYPPDPAWYAGDGLLTTMGYPHVCLLARAVCAGDPMYSENPPPTSPVAPNIMNNNNIVTHNTYVSDQFSWDFAMPDVTSMIQNIRDAGTFLKVRFQELDVDQSQPTFFDLGGTVTLLTDQPMWQMWQAFGGQGEGVEPIEPGLIRITGPNANLSQIYAEGNGAYYAGLRFEMPKGLMIPETRTFRFLFDHTTDDPSETGMMGGEVFSITVHAKPDGLVNAVPHPPSSVLENTGSMRSYPNPFTSITTVEYELRHAGAVTLSVYDPLGNKIQTLLSNSQQMSGWHSIDVSGENLPAGVYYLKLESGTQTQMTKVVLVK